MKWARIQKPDGTIVSGVLQGDILHPRMHLGSDKEAGEPVALADGTLTAAIMSCKLFMACNVPFVTRYVKWLLTH